MLYTIEEPIFNNKINGKGKDKGIHTTSKALLPIISLLPLALTLQKSVKHIHTYVYIYITRKQRQELRNILFCFPLCHFGKYPAAHTEKPAKP